MKIKAKILSGFLFILALTLLLAGVSVFYMERLGEASDKILKENYRSVKATEEVIISLSKMDQILAKIAMGGNYDKSNLFKILENEREILKNHIAICKNSISETGEAALVADLDTAFHKYQSIIAQFRGAEDKSQYFYSLLQRQNEYLREICVKLVDLNHNALSKKDQAAQKLYFQSNISVFIIMVLVLAIAGLAIYKIPDEIVRPILDITEKMKRIARGEYDQKINIDSNSELGELTSSFNTMSVKLQEFEQLNIEEIRAQKRRIETIIQNLNDGLIILDENENVILVNTTGENLLGIPASGINGKSAKKIARSNNVMKELLKAIKPEQEEEAQNNFLKINHGKDKTSYYTKEVIKVHGTSKRFLGYIITLKDITSFKESDEAKSNFIAVVSHELKTPLSALNMSLMLLRDERFGTINMEQEKITDSMKREVERLVNMVTELLDLSRVESGKINLDKHPVSPGLLVDYAIAPVESQFKEKNIRLEQQVSKGLPEINVDQEKISWVLINFLNNALKHAPSKTRVLLEVNKENGGVKFKVSDEGQGIAQESLKLIFNKFVQLPKNGKKHQSGLGLGLAISKDIVEVHGGQVGAESEVGKGSTFYFKIPVEKASTLKK